MSSDSGDRGLRAKGPGFAVALLVSILAAGTIGYMRIEHWSAWDAFYVSVLTVTTVGYGASLSRAGQVFTVLLLIGGVGAALYTFTLLATVVVEGGVPKRLQRRRHQRMLEAITDHFIVCGYGRIGAIVAQQLQRQRVPFVVIERDPGRLQQAIDHGALAVEADASREDVLKRVGIDETMVVVLVQRVQLRPQLLDAHRLF